MKNINWMDHLVNLVVVIAGITIAFGLNKCSESNNLAEDKEAIVISLQSDLQKDVEEIGLQYSMDSMKVLAISWLIENKANSMTEDSLNWAVSKLAESSRFTTNNVTYEGIKNSSKLSLFDLPLRNQMIQYYLIDYNGIKEIERYLSSNFDEYLVPIILSSIDIKTQRSDGKFVKLDSFWRALFLHLTFVHQRMLIFETALSDAKELKSALP